MPTTDVARVLVLDDCPGVTAPAGTDTVRVELPGALAVEMAEDVFADVVATTFHATKERDRRRHGTNNAGEQNGQAKMTADRVQEARQRFANGETKTALMRVYKIGRRGLERLLRGER